MIAKDKEDKRGCEWFVAGFTGICSRKWVYMAYEHPHMASKEPPTQPQAGCRNACFSMRHYLRSIHTATFLWYSSLAEPGKMPENRSSRCSRRRTYPSIVHFAAIVGALKLLNDLCLRLSRTETLLCIFTSLLNSYRKYWDAHGVRYSPVPYRHS